MFLPWYKGNFAFYPARNAMRTGLALPFAPDLYAIMSIGPPANHQELKMVTDLHTLTQIT